MSAYLEYFKERVPWARDMNDVDIVEHMSKVTGKPVRAVAEEFGIQSQYGLVPDIKRGFGQTVGGVGSTMQDLGMPDAGRAVENYGKRIVLENPSQINSFGDVLDKPLVTAREAVGEVVPQAGTALAGSTIGRIAGGALGLPFGPPGVALGSTIGGFAGGLLPIAAQTYGGIRAEQREQGIDDKERALLATVPATALERLGVEQIATRLGTKGLKNFATDKLKPGETTWGYAGRQAMKTGLVEGPFTEIPQTALERYGAYKDLTSEEALNEYGVAGVKGYVGGVAVGGAMSPFSLLPESNPSPKPDIPPAPAPAGQQMGLFTPEETPPTPGAVAPTGAPAFADAQAENAVRDLLVQRAQFATRMASAQTSQNAAEFYQAQDIVGRIDQQLAQLPQGLVESVARGMQAPSGQLGLFGAQPFNQAPPVPLQQVETSPGAITAPSQQEAEWLQQQAQVEREYAALGDAAATTPYYRQARAEEARLSPQRGLFDYYQEAQPAPPAPQQGPVLTNNQNPNQGELFFPNGQPTYAASQGIPDVAGAAAETSRAAGIPAGRPGSKAGSVRQQLLERIEKARMEGRFVGREAQYDDLVNDLTVNAFGRVEKTLAEVEKAPLLPAATQGASPLAAPGTRTLQDVDAEMDAMLVNGRAPKAGVAREAWNELQRERDALAAQVGAPPRPKYVPPKKTATPDNASRPTAAPTPVPAPAPVPPSPPARPVVEKAPPAPKKEAPAPLKETAQQAFDAMQDEIAYKDLTPEAKGMVDGAHKEGRLSQEEIDFIVKQDKAAKIAAKRAANKPKPEADLEDDEAPPKPAKKAKKAKAEDVPPVVSANTEVTITAFDPEAKKMTQETLPADEALDKLNEQKDIFRNFVNCLKK